MPRGRRALPDAVKELKGNPGKRRLASLDKSKTGKPPAEAAGAKPAPAFKVPDFLTEERERAIFRTVVEDYLQRRVARPPDLTAYARWAHYLHRWIICKETLDGKATFFKSTSKHGDLLRRHPLFKDQLDLERVLQALEDRLGLNPASRQNIIRGLAALPPAMGDFFGDDPKPKEPEAPPPPEAPGVADLPASPLNFLERGARSLN